MSDREPERAKMAAEGRLFCEYNNKVNPCSHVKACCQWISENYENVTGTWPTFNQQADGGHEKVSNALILQVRTHKKMLFW